MMNLLVPLFSECGGNGTELPVKPPRKLSDTLNELVVIIFFSLGPALGATIFLMWLGGLLWGLTFSFFH